MEKLMTDWEALYTNILSAGSNYEKAKKNIISTIILILLTSLTFAQTEKSIKGTSGRTRLDPG